MQIFWFGGDEAIQPEVLVRHAKLAEAAGFDGMLVSEHFHPWVDDVGAAGFAFSTLGAMAVATTKLRFMTAVTTPLWRFHPAVVAQAAATIDRLSDGRFALGVGTGENINEAALGVELPPYSERSGRMREALTIMSGLLAGETVSFDGQYYHTDAAKLYSPPVGKVPIYVAAGGPKGAMLAGSASDGIIVSVKDVSEAVRQVIQPAIMGAKEAGRPNPFVVATHWSVYAQDDAEAMKALAPWRGLRAPSRAKLHDPAKLRAEADDLPKEDILSRYAMVRGPEDYIREYGQIATKLKPDVLGIQTTSTNLETTIEMLGTSVLPELRKL